MNALERLNVRVFADGVDVDGIAAMAENRFIEGFTTNPTIMRKAGWTTTAGSRAARSPS